MWVRKSGCIYSICVNGFSKKLIQHIMAKILKIQYLQINLFLERSLEHYKQYILIRSSKSQRVRYQQTKEIS